VNREWGGGGGGDGRTYATFVGVCGVGEFDEADDGWFGEVDRPPGVGFARRRRAVRLIGRAVAVISISCKPTAVTDLRHRLTQCYVPQQRVGDCTHIDR